MSSPFSTRSRARSSACEPAGGERAGAWIVEDDYDGEFAFAGSPLPTLKSVDATGLVLCVGTFSKSLFPSLRLGFMLVPPALVDVLNAIMSKLLHGVPSCVQSELAVARAAAERQVTVSPIGRFCMSPITARGLVLGFGGIRPVEIEAGVVVLGEVLERQMRRRRGGCCGRRHGPTRSTCGS